MLNKPTIPEESPSLLLSLPIKDVNGPLKIFKKKIEQISSGLVLNGNIEDWFESEENGITITYISNGRDIVRQRGIDVLEKYGSSRLYATSDNIDCYSTILLGEILTGQKYITVDKIYGDKATNTIYISTTDTKPRWYKWKWVRESCKYTRISEEECEKLALYEIGKLQHIPEVKPAEDITLGDDTYPAGTLQSHLHTENWEIVQGKRGNISIGRSGSEEPPTILETYKQLRLSQARGIGDFTVVEFKPTQLVKNLLGKVKMRKNTYLLIDKEGKIVGTQKGTFNGQYFTVIIKGVSYLFPVIDSMTTDAQQVKTLIEEKTKKTIKETLTFEDMTPIRELFKKLQKMFSDPEGNNILWYGEDTNLYDRYIADALETTKEQFRVHLQKIWEMFVELEKKHQGSSSLALFHNDLTKFFEKIAEEAHVTDLLWKKTTDARTHLSDNHPLQIMLGEGKKTFL